MSIYVDADACPVKDEIYRVAIRHGLPVSVVAGNFIRVPQDPLIERIAAGSGTEVAEVNKLLKMHRQMSDMMKRLGKGKGGLGGLFGGGAPQPDPAMLEQIQKGGLGGLPGGMPGLGGGLPGGMPKLPGLGGFGGGGFPGLPGLGKKK